MNESQVQAKRAITMLALLLSFSPGAMLAADALRPNIIVIMVDDMGFSDLGCYGGEIHTPHIDGLAARGLRFSSFYNTSRCCPTRAALLTGLYPHQAGVGAMTHDTGRPGYRGFLQPNCVTIAEVLRPAGYRAAMVGKWHLSITPRGENHMAWLNHQADHDRDFGDTANYPVGRGFEEHYGIIWGVADFFDPFSLVHNTTPVKSVPADYYITDALTDRAIEYVEKYTRGREPLFLYLAYTAPHWPLHALPEDIAKYEGVYEVGWDTIRRRRYERQVEMGLIDADDAVLSPSLGNEQTWRDEPNKVWESRCMAVHAAMIDRVDQGIGRLIGKLKAIDEYDDTLILFLSDNGASSERPGRYRPGFDRNNQTRDGRTVKYAPTPRERSFLPGDQTTYAGIGEMWANASNTPFRYWKAQQHEGGVCTPLIAHWPRGMAAKAGAITRQTGHVIDIMATCVDLAGADYPKQHKGRDITPVEGKSLVPIFKGEKRDGHDAIYFEHQGSRAIRQGGWKLVAMKGRPWELYHLAEDRTEMNDLAAAHPQRVKAMAEAWTAWAKRCHVEVPRDAAEN